MIPETKHRSAPFDERSYLRRRFPGSTLLELDVPAALAALDALSPEERISLLWPEDNE